MHDDSNGEDNIVNTNAVRADGDRRRLSTDVVVLNKCQDTNTNSCYGPLKLIKS